MKHSSISSISAISSRGNLMLSMIRIVFVICSVTSLASTAYTQTKANPPDLNGAWGPYRAGRGADPKLAPPPATPIVLKPQYAKPYEARRAAEAEATRRGEQLATASVACVPYGVPSMMSVAVYPVEIIQT